MSIAMPAPPGHIQTIGSPSDGGTAEWRTWVDWDFAPVAEISPTAALWIERVCDEAVAAALWADRIAWMTGQVPSADEWMREAARITSSRFRYADLTEEGRAYGIDLTGGPHIDALVDILIAAAANRRNAPATWETELIRHMLWWRARAYDAVARAAETEGD